MRLLPKEIQKKSLIKSNHTKFARTKLHVGGFLSDRNRRANWHLSRHWISLDLLRQNATLLQELVQAQISSFQSFQSPNDPVPNGVWRGIIFRCIRKCSQQVRRQWRRFQRLAKTCTMWLHLRGGNVHEHGAFKFWFFACTTVQAFASCIFDLPKPAWPTPWLASNLPKWQLSRPHRPRTTSPSCATGCWAIPAIPCCDHRRGLKRPSHP